MVPAVAAALNKCGDDKMIVKSAEDEGLYMANTPADANDPAAAAKCKEDAKAVTAANWWFAPYNRLAYRNMEKLVQCAHVPRGAMPNFCSKEPLAFTSLMIDCQSPIVSSSGLDPYRNCQRAMSLLNVRCTLK